MFHNVIIKKIAPLVVLLNNELYYNFFCNHILFTVIARQCHYMTITSKLVLLNFLFDLFGYLVNFLTMFYIYRMLMNYSLRFVLLILLIVYFVSAQECTRSLSFRDAG